MNINCSADVRTNCLDLSIKEKKINIIEFLLKFKRKPKYAYSRVALPNNLRRLKVSSGPIGSTTT